MSANQRGCLIFIVMIVVAVVFCFLVPFVLLPGAGSAVALPVIQLPGEVYQQDWPSPNFEFTNTLMGTILADILVIGLALLAYWRTRRWTNQIPGRFQGIVEFLVGFLYGYTKNMAGTASKVRNQLFPLVASIFLFLLLANWLELIPGVDSIGILHCAHTGQNGYTVTRGTFAGAGATYLYNDQIFFSGYPATHDDFESCEAVLHNETEDTIVMPIQAVDAEQGQIEAEATVAAEGNAEAVEEEQALDEEIDDAEETAGEAEAGDDHAEGEAVAEEPHEEEHHVEALPYNAETIALAQAEGKVQMGTGAPVVAIEGDTPESIADRDDVETSADEIAELNGPGPYTEGEEIYTEPPDLVGRFAQTPENNLFVVTPYVRAAATDLNLTFGLAIISIIAIQYFGMASLGMSYWQKFININALGNLSKRPMGAMDFVVGLFEIISEISKIISLSFRLFGNIFAGQLLLFVMAFLVATLLPVVFYGLETLVGAIQAFVFAVLTLVFSAQAMQGHHHEEDEEH